VTALNTVSPLPGSEDWKWRRTVHHLGDGQGQRWSERPDQVWLHDPGWRPCGLSL